MLSRSSGLPRSLSRAKNMRTLLTLLLTIVGTLPLAAAERTRSMLKLELDGKPLEGLPLAWSNENVILLDRVGKLWEFDPNTVSKFQATPLPFSSHSLSLMQTRLRDEFGPNFEVVSTGHYLVVHPRGHGAHWSRRFEELYRS